MGKMLTIYEALLNRQEKVCRKSDIMGIVEEYKRRIGKINSKNTLWYLSRHDYIKRIFLDFYYINSLDERERGFCLYEDRELLFIALNKLGIKWYIGLSSALHLLGKAWQTPAALNIINTSLSGKKRILGMNVRFARIKGGLVFGLKQSRTKNSIPYAYSDLAKTYIDLAYFRKTDKIITAKHTYSYLRNYPKWLNKLI